MAAVTHEHTRYSKDETDRYADAYNHRIHYNDVGSGPVLFCFHGGGPGSNAWDNTKHNLDDLAIYAKHEHHLPVVERSKEICEQVASVDYEY